METARIIGGERLIGDVVVSGSKNACLPILAASILTDEACVIHNVPMLKDVAVMLDILSALGAEVEFVDRNSVKIHAKKIIAKTPEDLAKKMRGSVCLMGALIARSGKAIVPKPGGCLIGSRPIDLHIKGFEALGCNMSVDGSCMMIDGENLTGARIYLGGKFGSTMTGTMNVVMAALRARGETIINCAAMEPEVVDFCRYLVAMGAKIEGIGTSSIKIYGQNELHGCEYRIIGDRIEAGTFVYAGLMTGGEINIFGLGNGLLDACLTPLSTIGPFAHQGSDGVIHVKAGEILCGTNIETGPHPAFPTDLQAQFCAFLTQSSAESTITERVYPDRFLYVDELKKMGADLTLNSGCVHIKSSKGKLCGEHLKATDLRASAALYLAGLCAKGETFVHDVYHLDRGYEAFEKKLSMLGAKIQRITD